MVVFFLFFVLFLDFFESIVVEYIVCVFLWFVIVCMCYFLLLFDFCLLNLMLLFCVWVCVDFDGNFILCLWCCLGLGSCWGDILWLSVVVFLFWGVGSVLLLWWCGWCFCVCMLFVEIVVGGIKSFEFCGGGE